MDDDEVRVGLLCDDVRWSVHVAMARQGGCGLSTGAVGADGGGDGSATSVVVLHWWVCSGVIVVVVVVCGNDGGRGEATALVVVTLRMQKRNLDSGF